MRGAYRALVAALAAVAVAAPAVVTSSSAAWRDDEWAHGTARTTSLRCGQDQGFAAASSGRFLSGSLLGTDLDAAASVRGVRLERAADGTLTVTPPTATDPGSTPPAATRVNPLSAGALGVTGLDASGLAVGVPAGAAGGLAQYARVSGHGTAAGAAGLVSGSGAVLVTPTTPGSALPGPAYVSLGTLLPAISQLSDTRLRVGAVASSAVLDGCADLRASLWRTGSVVGATRAYGVADLGVRTTTPVLGQLTGAVGSTVTGLQTTLGQLTGPTGLISQAISTALAGRLSAGLSQSPMTGTVTISDPNLAGAVSSLLTTPTSDGVVTLHPSTGVVEVDLDALLGYAPGALSNQPPNTAITLTPELLAPIATRTTALLTTWSGQVTTALRTAIRAATLTVDLTTRISATGLLGTAEVAVMRIQLTAPVGAVLDSADGTAVPPTAQVVVTVTGTGLGGAILTLLGLTLAALVSLLTGSGPVLLVAIANQLRTSLLTPVTTLGTTLTTTAAPLGPAMGTLADAVARVVRLTLNVQPDRPGAPAGETFVAGTRTSTPEYRVTALRLGLVAYPGTGSVAYTRFATSSAGPVRAPPTP